MSELEDNHRGVLSAAQTEQLLAGNRAFVRNGLLLCGVIAAILIVRLVLQWGTFAVAFRIFAVAMAVLVPGSLVWVVLRLAKRWRGAILDGKLELVRGVIESLRGSPLAWTLGHVVIGRRSFAVPTSVLDPIRTDWVGREVLVFVLPASQRVIAVDPPQ